MLSEYLIKQFINYCERLSEELDDPQFRDPEYQKLLAQDLVDDWEKRDFHWDSSLVYFGAKEFLK